jgi:ABC-2 type transport system ATP-binding protein
MIKIENISKTYGNKKVLQNVSFNVKKGEPFSIIGRNGAGKSTTIKIMLGLLSPDSGNVVVEKDITVGYLPEDRGLYAESTVYEHMKLFGKLSNIENLPHEITKTIARFELTNYKNIKVKQLSKGNAQKLQLALTFLGHPTLVILDEPLSGLDPINKNLLKRIIQEEKEHSYIILSSHQMEFVEEICSEAMFIKAGQMIEAGNIAELKKKYGAPNLVLPYVEETIEKLSEISHLGVRKNSTFVIKCEDNKEALFSFIMRKVPDIEYIKYQYSDIDDMYVRLLGEGEKTT